MIAWGEVAYEAYRNHTGGKSLVSGAPIPEWDALGPDIQSAWDASAQAVRQTCINLIGMNQAEPVNECSDEPAPVLALQVLREWIETWRTEWEAEGHGTAIVEDGAAGNGGQTRFVYVTGKNRYSIVARPAGAARSYLGAQASRIDGGGRDLADGPLNEDTWRSIVADIRNFEAGTGRFAPLPVTRTVAGPGVVIDSTEDCEACQ